MDLQIYKLVVKSNLYKVQYNIRAENLAAACKKAKIKFGQSYSVFGDKVKVELDHSDIGNHIEEIMGALYRSK